MPKIYKELIQLNRKIKPSNLIKWTKDLYRHYYKDNAKGQQVLENTLNINSY